MKKDARDKGVPLRLQGRGGGVGWDVPAGLPEFQPAGHRPSLSRRLEFGERFPAGFESFL